MKTASAKAKGRRLASEVRELFLSYAQGEIEPGDIVVTPSSVAGEDLIMSPKAKAIYPFAVECKNQQNISIWACLNQASSHALGTENIALLCFRRNRSDTYACLKLEDFLKLIR